MCVLCARAFSFRSRPWRSAAALKDYAFYYNIPHTIFDAPPMVCAPDQLRPLPLLLTFLINLPTPDRVREDSNRIRGSQG